MPPEVGRVHQVRGDWGSKNEKRLPVHFLSLELQQGSKRIKPIDIGKAERGRKNESSGPAFRSRFTALFAYEQFDPTASSIFVANLQDGKEIRIPADFSKVK